ncbi:MAG: hypothetical protein EA397_18180 [Deltaproteobacteria bacterium]|nr:MAG: hypothetical protein EA397_18180 [Deltaproteobacteria bacterium]
MSDGSALPRNTARDEDAFVAALRDGPEPDLEQLAELVSLAMGARRPRLAARLVQLLPDHVEIEPGSALERAERASRLLVLKSDDAEAFESLDVAWREVRRNRMRRMLNRQRLVGTNRQYTHPRVGRRRRR